MQLVDVCLSFHLDDSHRVQSRLIDYYYLPLKGFHGNLSSSLKSCSAAELSGSHLENAAFKWICPGASVVSGVSIRKPEPSDPVIQ